jgi:opacity protein-like surface antigen
MIGHSKLALIFAAAAVAGTQAVHAAGVDAKAWTGTWHLDAAKSKWTAAGKEQSETRTYSYAGGKLTMKSTFKNAAGKETNFSYSAALDGKFYPMVGNPNGDSIALTRVSPNELKATSRLHGKPKVQTDASVSADGKHLTLKRTFVAMKGTPTEVLEFNR